ncbi:putative bifunctional diguanylate cyclase/phosphodiesterase [Lichenifustis flavocetrariae]|uniref:EAL domain-containing protein n=1 Tax=Lichenifustis flavocetrariae TaxID=2949735 RepID=A0AA41Z9M1_9HYPH|nr:EAL domain-containing protein [Lichenifustis flavocetrariae]MCW6512835.1 EAL domain-containing protein [Lichenifustis flavocetrariae]
MRLLPNHVDAWPTHLLEKRFGRLLVSGTLLAAVSLVVGLGCTGRQLRDEARTASQQALRVAELRGSIAYLDEWLTASARLAVATGEHHWADRYNEALPKLDAAIAEAAELASPETRGALASTTGEAHRDLVTMERRALSLAKGGDLASARALLDGPEFAYLKDVYASGIDGFGQDLAAFNAARTDALTDRAWLQAWGLALAVVVLVATGLWVLWRARLKKAQAHIVTVARTDILTGLPNRQRFYEAAEVILAEQTPQGRALLLIDLDRFKSVNETFGHDAGDEVLKLVAARLRGVVRGGDLLARLGGDEFALVLGQDGTLLQSGNEADAVAARIVTILADPFVIHGSAVQIGASVGISIQDPPLITVSDLMHRADVALSRAKLDGRRCVRIFEPEMDVEMRSRVLLERDLRQAVAQDVVVPHYQPLVDLRTGALVGFEMLARWPHPTRGMVPPDVFIPLAEDLGLIGALTEGLMRQACREATSWPHALTLACNLSPVQLCDPGLPGAIRAVLNETGLLPSRLELEVTESALVGDLALARASLGQLKVLGVRLAIDDFGTGYSSLRHLQSLPFDKIKIDRGFVAGMADNIDSGKIVSAVVGLGRSLGLVTVAEGIETETIAGLLRDLGCDIGQGWLFGRPVSADQIVTILSEEPVEHRAVPAAA